MEYMFLKSGTDVRGIASDLGGKAVELTDKAVYDISAAFAVWCVNKFIMYAMMLAIAPTTIVFISSCIPYPSKNSVFNFISVGILIVFLSTTDLHLLREPSPPLLVNVPPFPFIDKYSL